MKTLAPLGAALVALVLLTSGHRFANDFVFDDDAVIREGTLIHDPSRLGEAWTNHTMVASSGDVGQVQSVDTYRPLTITLFVLDAQLSGRSPVGYHVTNLLLHLGCVLLVFAVHPWAIEAHVWINGRSDPLALLLGLAAMLVLLRSERAEQKRARATALAGSLFLLGLLSKETLLLTAPAILVMPPPEGCRTPRRARITHRALAIGISSALYLGARAIVLGGLRAHRDESMVLAAAKNLPLLLFDSLRQALVPSLPYLRSLRDEYGTLGWWHVAGASLAILAVAVLAWRARPLLAWSTLWFFAPLLPVAIITTVLWPGFGRYLYIPLAGVSWAIASVVPWVRARIDRPSLRYALASLHVLSLGAMAALFTRDFRSSDSLYAAAIEARPDVAMGHGWLGIARFDGGDPEGALEPLLRAAELDPGTHRYSIRAGRAALATGHVALAAAIAERGIAQFRGTPDEASYHLLAVNSMRQRDPARAIGHLLRCIEVAPGRDDCARALQFLLTRAPDASANRAALEVVLPHASPAAADRVRRLE